MRVKEAQRKKEWFEKFLFFSTSGGFLALAGREAKQNELLYSRHLQEGDLFFHADLQGAPAVVLKNGEKAEEKDLLETAQFAACFSSAWKRGLHNVDVYAVAAKNVDKRAQGEFLGQGAFMIRGDRKWFRNVALRLKARKSASGVEIVPLSCGGSGIELMPGQTSKIVMVEKLAKTLGLAPDFSQQLPQGSFDLV
jgi:predicted ribosome quality control (RQC) complex YloA/Tae2 family protein